MRVLGGIRLLYLVFAAGVIFIAAAAAGLDNETGKIMPFVHSESFIFCSDCHGGAGSKNFRREGRACDPLCFTCHKNMAEGHHSVGARIDRRLPSNFRLAAGGKMACFTCHDLGMERYSDVRYRSESLVGSIFGIKARYKSYYLVMRNNRGQLCKVCH